MRFEAILKDIADPIIRENFLRLRDYLAKKIFLNGDWRFREVVFSSAVTKFPYKHNLTFVPKDIIVTSVIGPGAVTFNYADFDSEFIYITTTNAATIRFFMGNYEGDA